MDVEAASAELDRLRAQFPQLDWSYCVDKDGVLLPPTWPPEVPLAAKLHRAGGEGGAPAVAAARGGAPARARRGSTRDMCYYRGRQPGYRILSQSRTCTAPTVGARFQLAADVDPLQPDDIPGPGHYRDAATLGSMGARPAGPKYSMSPRWWSTLSSTVDPLQPDADTPGPGEYDVSHY